MTRPRKYTIELSRDKCEDLLSLLRVIYIETPPIYLRREKIEQFIKLIYQQKRKQDEQRTT